MRNLTATAAFLIACSSTTTDGPALTGDSTGSTNPTADTNGPTPGRSGDLSGIISSVDGQALEDADIRLCRGLACRFGDSDDAGFYAFADVHVDKHAFEIKPPADNKDLATAFVPLVFDQDEIRDINVVLPLIESTLSLPATSESLEVAPGVFLTVGVDDLEPPGVIGDDATEIMGTTVDRDHWMPIDDPDGVGISEDNILAMWYLGPFDYQATNSGLPIAVSNDELALPVGHTFRVYAGSYFEATWLDAGTLTVNEDGSMLTGDALLPLIGTIILVDSEDNPTEGSTSST